MIIVLLIPVIIVNLFNYFLPSKLHSGKEGMENKNPDQEKIDVLTKKTKTVSDSQVIVPSEEITNSTEDMNPTSDLSTSNEEFKNHDSKESNKDKKKKYHIDYASTVEEAYDNLNSVLGSDGIKSLTTDTKRLMQQQQDLAKSMKDIVPLVQSFEPMMNQAKGLLDSMGGVDGIKGLDGVKKMLSNIGSTSQ
jgi:hypothetical protein